MGIFSVLIAAPIMYTSLVVRDAQEVLEITGSFNGVSIMLFFPCLLVYMARKQYPEINTRFYSSSLQQTGVLIGIGVFGMLLIILAYI